MGDTGLVTYEIKQLLGRAAPNVNVDVRPPGAGLIVFPDYVCLWQP